MKPKDCFDAGNGEVLKRYPEQINPYCRRLIREHPELAPMYLADPRELDGAGLETDGLGEHALSPFPHLIRTYRDRALLLTTANCFSRCRFCFRKRLWRTDSPVRYARIIMDSYAPSFRLNSRMNCLENTSLDSGQSRLPDPPDKRMTCSMLLRAPPFRKKQSRNTGLLQSGKRDYIVNVFLLYGNTKIVENKGLYVLRMKRNESRRKADSAQWQAV